MFKKIRLSAKNFKNTNVICTAAVFAALFVVLYSAQFKFSSDLRMTFTFIPLALAGWLLGPVPAMLVGLVGDVLGCILFPSGPFFPGFTVTKILSGLLYGLFLFKSPKKNILHITGAVFSVNYLANVLLNSIWLSYLYGKVWTVYAMKHFLKNTILSPIEILLLILIMKILSDNGVKKMYK